MVDESPERKIARRMTPSDSVVELEIAVDHREDCCVVSVPRRAEFTA